MIALLFALAGALGVYLLYTSIAFGRTELSARRRQRRADGGLLRRTQQGLQGFLIEAGLDRSSPAQLVSVSAGLALLGGAIGFGLFGGVIPPLVVAAFAATAPIASARARAQRRREQARQAWPRMIEEVRLLTGSLGRSVPLALLDVGRRAPDELRRAFDQAEREWRLSTDFATTCEVLKRGLADATADVCCETLLVAHELGGSDIDRRLAALVEDRIADLDGRKDAVAKQAGVRFARRFVLVVPLGMALAGLSIGTGRDAYQSPLGQVLVAAGLFAVVACWLWAGRLMRLPAEERVFA